MRTVVNLIVFVCCLVSMSCSSLMRERQTREYGNNILLGSPTAEWAVRTDGTNLFYRGGTVSNINLSVSWTDITGEPTVWTNIASQSYTIITNAPWLPLTAGEDAKLTGDLHLDGVGIQFHPPIGVPIRIIGGGGKLAVDGDDLATEDFVTGQGYLDAEVDPRLPPHGAADNILRSTGAAWESWTPDFLDEVAADALYVGITDGVSTNQTFAGTNFWASSRVHYLPIDADINAYIASAAVQDGDVVELGAGTNTATSTITIGKSIRLRGQGRDKTAIACNTALGSNRGLLEVVTNYVALSDMRISLSGQTSNTALVFADGGGGAGIIGLRFERLDVASSNEFKTWGMNIARADAEIVDCEVSAITSFFAAYGIAVPAVAGDVAARNVNIYRSTIYASGYHLTSPCVGVEASSAISDFTNTVALYGCSVVATNTGSHEAYGVLAGDNIEIYGGSFNAKTYDLYQSSGTLTVHGSMTLVNNTTSGTITYAGATEAGSALTVSGVNVMTAIAGKASINDGSRFQSVWTGSTNTLYIVSADGAYTNLIMKTIGE